MIFSTCSFLFLMELLIRQTKPDFLIKNIFPCDINHYCVFDPDLGWRYRKNINGIIQEKQIYINNEGFRGRDIDFQNKLKDRILILGDSIPFGWGVADSETFPEILNKDKAFPFEVINTGVMGYGPDQELLLYKKYVKRIKPDKVILNICMANDLRDISSARNIYDGGHLPKPIFLKTNSSGYSLYRDHLKLSVWKRLLYEINYRSYLYNFMRYAINPNFKKDTLKAIYTTPNEMSNYNHDEESAIDEDSALEKMIYIIDELNILSKKNNQDLLLIIFPSETMFENKEEYNRYFILLKELQNKEIAVIDIYQALNINKDNYHEYALDDVFHLNENGHHIIAELIKDYINKHDD